MSANLQQNRKLPACVTAQAVGQEACDYHVSLTFLVNLEKDILFFSILSYAPRMLCFVFCFFRIPPLDLFMQMTNELW
jgi:hypothetical protein